MTLGILMASLAGAQSQIWLTNGPNVPMFDGAVLALKGINLSGLHAAIASDSWNSHDPMESTNGRYDGYSGTNGDMASMSGNISPGGETIQGSLFLGPTATYAGGGMVTGTIYTNANVLAPDAALPTNVVWTPAPTSIVNGISTHDFATNGYYLVSDSSAIVVEPGVTATLQVTTNFYDPLRMIFNGNMTNSGNLIMYQNSGSANLSGNYGSASDHRPENFVYFGLPDVTNIVVDDVESPFIGAMYAPEARVTIEGGNYFSGALVAASLQLSFSVIHYDTALRTNGYYIKRVAPTILIQPTNLTVNAGQTADFNLAAIGTRPMTYQWFLGATPLVHQTNSTLVLSNVQPAQAGNYSVMITNAYGGTTSSNAVLTVKSFPPVITNQPTSRALWVNGNVAFTVGVSGTPPFTYQWQLNGTNLPNGIITTVAGNGTTNFSGDGGPATDAGLDLPASVALDTKGDLFIADASHNCIRKVNTRGIITTIAGNGVPAYPGDGGPATNASLDWPTSVALGASGNVFIADLLNDRVRMVETNDIIITVAGSGTNNPGDGGAATNADLGFPNGVAIDIKGRLFFTENAAFRVRKVNTNGIISTVAGTLNQGGYSGDGGLAVNALLAAPDCVALDRLGNLFIADAVNNDIRKVDTNGIITTVAGVNPFSGISGYSGDGGAATNASLDNPDGMTVDSSGNLLFADSLNNRIRKVDTSGIITTIAGNGATNFFGDGGPATNASLNGPFDVAVDSGGNLFIADGLNNRIRKVTNTQGPTLALDDASAANAGNYRVVVTGPGGSVTSSVVNLVVAAAPLIYKSVANPDGSVSLDFLCPPDSTNVVFCTTNLTPPAVWQPVSTNLAGSDGAWRFTDTNALDHQSQFYRSETW